MITLTLLAWFGFPIAAGLQRYARLVGHEHILPWAALVQVLQLVALLYAVELALWVVFYLTHGN